MAKLTPKQARFVDEYLVDRSATQAAIRAGYSKDTARIIGAQNLTKLNISEAIAEKEKTLEKDTGVTPDYVRDKLKLIVENSLQLVAVRDSDGAQENTKDGTPAFRVLNAGQANKSLETLAKIIGMFDDKKNGNGDGTTYTLKVDW